MSEFYSHKRICGKPGIRAVVEFLSFSFLLYLGQIFLN